MDRFYLLRTWILLVMEADSELLRARPRPVEGLVMLIVVVERREGVAARLESRTMARSMVGEFRWEPVARDSLRRLRAR